MESFLLFVFWVLVAFYAFRLAFRYLMPWLLKRFFNKLQQNMSNAQQQAKPRKEGEVNVNYTPVDSPRIDPNLGEYVDFEDIQDNNQSNK